ncbi:MAG: DISARM system SNF2-like helicase DrmD, partial [Phycicoccus sp.]
MPTRVDADAVDDPHVLGACLDAVRWGAVTSADDRAYQAPFRSGATVEAYQLEPLARALRAPRTNLLLADDVGLGKTIEAGLVIQELLRRHRARSVVIVCPPSLSIKWQTEMREKFGLDFVIVDSALMAQVRRSHGLAANPLKLFPRVIVSMAWLPGVRAQRLFRDVREGLRAPGSARRWAFDALIVDEAHHVAPSSPSALGGGRGYAVDSQRTLATRALAEVCEHRLFLTATPHNGYSESFTALLEMVDDRRFTRGAAIDAQALAEVTVRRLKSSLADDGAFPARVFESIPFDPDPGEEEHFERLHGILAESARRNGREQAGDLLGMLLKKRFLSSPWSFAQTLDLYTQARGVGVWPEVIDDYYEQVLGSGASDEEEGESAQPEFTALRASKGTDPLVAASPGDIDALVAWGRGYEYRPDARLTALVGYLEATCRPDGVLWSNERVVVFTEYTETMRWVVRVLEAAGLGGERLATISGSDAAEERERTRARFTADPTTEPLRILVATDAAGEGIDLQTHCHRLVNLDVPFNPSRLEQRLGRIDRWGQEHNPVMLTIAPTSTSGRHAADLDFMGRLVTKIERVKTELGSVNEIVDAQVLDHFAPRRTAGPPRSRRAVDDAKVINDQLAAGMRLNSELTRLSQSYADRKVALHLTPQSTRRVVDTALDLDGQPALVVEGSQDTDAPVFAVPALSARWQASLRGLDTILDPGVLRPITFDDAAIAGRGERDRANLVHIHLGHPLLQRSARLLRTELLRPDSRLHGWTAVVVPGLEHSCAASVSRLVLVGKGGLRLHEEVFVTGVRLSGQAVAEGAVLNLLDRALDSPRLAVAAAEVRERVAARWNEPGSRLRGRLETDTGKRAERQQHQVTDQLAERERADGDRAAQIFGAFRRNLTESIDRLEAEERDAAYQLFA